MVKSSHRCLIKQTRYWLTVLIKTFDILQFKVTGLSFANEKLQKYKVLNTTQVFVFLNVNCQFRFLFINLRISWKYRDALQLENIDTPHVLQYSRKITSQEYSHHTIYWQMNKLTKLRDMIAMKMWQKGIMHIPRPSTTL